MGLADLCIAFYCTAAVPAVVGENHGICVLSSLHSEIIEKTLLTFTCLFVFTCVLRFLIAPHTYVLCQ